MNYERYDRFFIIMEGQSEAFAMRTGEPAKGHIKIETGNNRGAMRIGVQNVKYYEKSEYVYKLIFFGTVREKMIHAIIGTVNVNRMGSGETYFRFDPVSMDENGHSLADFSHAIVAAVSVNDEKEPLHPVLKGTLDMPPYGEEREALEQDEGMEISGENRGEQAGLTDNTYADESRNASTAAGRAEASMPAEGAPMCYNSYYNKYIAAQCFRMDRDKNVYDRVVPFKNDVTGAEWTKVTGDIRLPMVSPGAQMLSEKYKHYIFGKNEKYYYFGVPGRFLREEQPEEGASGFILWQPILGAEDYNATEETTPIEVRRMAYGYWIVAVDIKNGDILEA